MIYWTLQHEDPTYSLLPHLICLDKICLDRYFGTANRLFAIADAYISSRFVSLNIPLKKSCRTDQNAADSCKTIYVSRPVQPQPSKHAGYPIELERYTSKQCLYVKTAFARSTALLQAPSHHTISH